MVVIEQISLRIRGKCGSTTYGMGVKNNSV